MQMHHHCSGRSFHLIPFAACTALNLGFTPAHTWCALAAFWVGGEEGEGRGEEARRRGEECVCVCVCE